MFTITVSGQSPEELEMRIQDNIERGFRLVKRLDPVYKTHGGMDYFTGNDSWGRTKRKDPGTTSSSTFKAIMERENAR